MTPPHWKQAQNRTIKLHELQKIKKADSSKERPRRFVENPDEDDDKSDRNDENNPISERNRNKGGFEGSSNKDKGFRDDDNYHKHDNNGTNNRIDSRRRDKRSSNRDYNRSYNNRFGGRDSRDRNRRDRSRSRERRRSRDRGDRRRSRDRRSRKNYSPRRRSSQRSKNDKRGDDRKSSEPRQVAEIINIKVEDKNDITANLLDQPKFKRRSRSSSYSSPRSRD